MAIQRTATGGIKAELNTFAAEIILDALRAHAEIGVKDGKRITPGTLRAATLDALITEFGTALNGCACRSHVGELAFACPRYIERHPPARFPVYLPGFEATDGSYQGNPA